MVPSYLKESTEGVRLETDAQFFVKGLMHFPGTQGRALYWHPGQSVRKKAVSASFPELSCRFAKETSMAKETMLSDIDFIDVTARSETMNTVLSSAAHKHAIQLWRVC